MALIGSSALIFGGIYEREDRQYVLDDCQMINVEKLEKYTSLRPLSVDLENWEGSDSDSEEEDSDSDSENDSDSDSDSYCSDSDSDSESDSEDEGEFYTRPETIDSSIPQPFPDQSLKDYFADNQEFWITRSREKYNTLTNSKQLRAEAFQMAQQAFNEFDLHRMLLK